MQQPAFPRGVLVQAKTRLRSVGQAKANAFGTQLWPKVLIAFPPLPESAIKTAARPTAHAFGIKREQLRPSPVQVGPEAAPEVKAANQAANIFRDKERAKLTELFGAVATISAAASPGDVVKDGACVADTQRAAAAAAAASSQMKRN